MADGDISEISESSYADARADTPTLGEHRSGSEDTLSNLSLDDEILEKDNGEIEGEPFEVPVPAPRKSREREVAEAVSPNSTSASYASAVNGSIKVCVTDADLEMADSLSLDLPPGAHYLPTSVDFVRSPSELKNLKGPSFMPKQETAEGGISEDESSVSSYQAHLDLNGEVRLVKKDNNQLLRPNFLIPQINCEEQIAPQYTNHSSSASTPCESFLSVTHHPSDDALDEYIEDFILPLSHESVMQRQRSFRKKVKNTYDEIAAEKAAQEIDRFEAMLSTYDEEDENSRSITPDIKSNANYKPITPVPKIRMSKTVVKHSTPSQQSPPTPHFDLEPQSLFDIDQIVNENAPNLMGSHNRKGSSDSTGTLSNGAPYSGDLESLSNYFLPQQTIDKLYAVYESSNFNNIYCLSGEIKNILSATEIEEILDNKDQLERYIDPNVMAALSWSLNPASLPPTNNNNNNNSNNTSTNAVSNNKLRISDQDDDGIAGLKSKSSSMSNGFHSDASSEDDSHSTSSASEAHKKDGERGNESGIDSPSPTALHLQRGTPMTNSMRRRIALSKGMRSPTLNEGEEGRRTIDDELDEIDLGLEEDWEDENGRPSSAGSNSGGTCFVRRDSKRFSFKGKDGQIIDRVIEGIFVESKNSNPKGTLRRIKAPLNLTEGSDELDLDSPEPPVENNIECKETEELKNEEAKGHKQRRKKISVDENILSMISSTEFDDGELNDGSQATNVTESDIFYSIRNSTLKDEDPTMRTENGEDDDEITLDIDTPDDMEDSIMGQLESLATTSPRDTVPPLPLDEDDSIRYKSYRVGPGADVQIDIQAINPYRKCLSHGGYFDAEKNVAIILFSGCYLPDRSSKDYTHLMDHLFLYVLSTLEELIVEDYILVYLHGATPKSCVPTYAWLKKCYQLINHRLRKNLKGLYLVHPTFWLRTVVALTRPFVSTKFSRKVRFMYTLSDLCLEIPTEHLVIPDCVLQYDFDLKVEDLKRRGLN